MTAVEKETPQVSTTDLIAVESAPASISVNFEEVRARLEAELQKYDVVVTVDTVADAKKLATELNQSATEFGKRRREAVAMVSGPIKAFEEQMKQLEGMCKVGRGRILDQVQKFEDVTREKARELLEAKRTELWESNGIQPEFRRAEFEDLVKLTAVTKKGNLTAATLNELRTRVAADKQLQDQTRVRLLELENQSYRAGLTAPLTRDHVEPFLFAPAEQYQQSLDRIIASELNRQAQAEAATRARLEREQREAQERQEAEQRRQEEARQAGERQQAAEVSRRDLPRQMPVAGDEAATDKPDPMPAPSTQPAPVDQRHAYGPLSAPQSASIVTCPREGAERYAIETATPTTPFGVWTPAGLVSIIYSGRVFRAV